MSILFLLHLKKNMLHLEEFFLVYQQMRWLVLFLSFSFVFSSCQKLNEQEGDTRYSELWEISHKTCEASHFYPSRTVECMIITSFTNSKPSIHFTLPLGLLEGFEYQAGYRYRVIVTVTHFAKPMQDAPTYKYQLKEIIATKRIVE